MKRFAKLYANKLTVKVFYDFGRGVWELSVRWWRMIRDKKWKMLNNRHNFSPVKGNFNFWWKFLSQGEKFFMKISPRSVISLSAVCRVIDSWWSWVQIVFRFLLRCSERVEWRWFLRFPSKMILKISQLELIKTTLKIFVYVNDEALNH